MITEFSGNAGHGRIQ